MSSPLITPALSRLQQRYRRHILASDTRAGSWARGHVRRRWLAFAQDCWQPLAAMTAVAAALIATLTFMAPNAFLRGAALGAGVAGAAALLMTFIAQASGTAMLSAGATAEQFTASELRALLKDGWRLMNHFGLRREDIDHILVGPAGVVVIETKWSTRTWDLTRPSSYLRAAVEQVQRNTRDVAHWHTVKRAGITEVWSAVFLWSGYDTDASARPQSPQRHDRTQVVYGRTAAAHWRNALLTAPIRLTSEQIDQLCSDIDAHLRARDAHDAAAHPTPASVATAYWTVLASLAAFATASLISLYSFTLTHSWIAWATTLTAETVTGIVVLKRTRAPRAVTGSWLAGAAIVAAIALVALVISAR